MLEQIISLFMKFYSHFVLVYYSTISIQYFKATN